MFYFLLQNLFDWPAQTTKSYVS